MFTLHQYLVPAVVKFVLAWLMFVPVVTLVLVAKLTHAPDELLLQLTVIVSLSVSLATMYSVGLGVMLVNVSVGASLACVGG